MSNVAKTIAGAQITNGGPVILYQPENEYTWSANCETVPDGEYMQYVIDQARNAGIVVPMISNDAAPNADDAPGSGTGAVDIYGHDAYLWVVNPSSANITDNVLQLRSHRLCRRLPSIQLETSMSWEC